MADAANREMYQEIAALIGAMAKAFARPESEIVAALEKNLISLDFASDENGNRFVLARFGAQSARLYQGAIKTEAGQA